MKKIILLLIALTLGFGVKAQTSLTQAVDFTVTDVHGTQVHLFDILDSGQAVLIDFFYTTCTYCIQTIPYMVQSYQSMGCNMHDVFYLEVDNGDTEQACLNWVNNYGVEYPTIAGVSGGNGICNQYGISYYPTVILIAPDHSIVVQDLWPINNAQSVISALEAHGLEQHDCTPSGSQPEVTIAVDQVTETEVLATFTPNEYCATYYYTIATEEEIQQWMATAGLQLPEYLQSYGFPADDVISQIFSDLEFNTEYTIYAVGTDDTGNFGEVVTETVTTLPGGTIEIMPDFTATDIDGNEINLYSILDTGQAVLINFFLTGDEYSINAIRDVVEAFHNYGCNEHDVFFIEISSNGHDEECQAWVEEYEVQYPTISRDGGGNDIAQSIPVGFYPTVMVIRPDHSFAQRDVYPPTFEQIATVLNDEGYSQFYCIANVDETDNAVNIFPNPANESVTLKGELLGLVSIYNALGQKVDEFNAKDELNINTARYENGMYVIKTENGTVSRFVVKH